MKLADLLTNVRVISVSGDSGVDVRAIRYDSRDAGPDSLFVAMEGQLADGNEFVPQAVAAGAVAIVSEREPFGDVTWVRVESARVALAELAACFWGHPTRELRLVGITGQGRSHRSVGVFRKD